MAATEPRNATVAYPGGLRARWRWGGSGSGPAVFALTEVGGTLIDLGPRVAADPDAAVPGRAAARGTPRRLDGPLRLDSSTTSRAACYWDTAGLLVVAYGFHTYGLEAATGEARWDHRSATPIVALLGSSRLAHVLVQSELETFAIEPDGTVAWRIAHSDVVTAAELVGGRLVLTELRGPGQRARSGDRARRRPDARQARPRRVDRVWTDGG